VRAAALALLLATAVLAEETHAARGILLTRDEAHHLLVVSCDAIPGYMDAMEMEFHVGSKLPGVKRGDAIEFRMVTSGGKLWAEDVRMGTTANFEAEPMAAGQLTAMDRLMRPVKVLAVGDVVPDFALSDQTGKMVRLSEMRGKVVALTFGYSRCPNPNYCFRLSHNLQKVRDRMGGSDFEMVTIMIDPEHDQGAALRQYAEVFGADAANWHFLTGPVKEIREIAARFGMNFWSEDGLITHSLHTVLIDRHGRMAVNLEGNGFTAGQLGDLVRTVLLPGAE
jgi:protein SCO1/2